MKTMPSVDAQNHFGVLIDTAQIEVVSVTRKGRTVAYVMSPDVAQDWVDGQIAMQAEQSGFLSTEETEDFLNSIRNAVD
ncbi:Antitoxin of toxin-antitoxin system StbD [Crenothrix polyspora]|uniref:Antitoxin of toxin-antitoxin system StbD n=1 Tax=Crenothrix polyspora TaxID=360316 RepID=A0A1R4HBF5_9GAMM|nr:type II toxin-antitoxin system Phd/YefM family antitoxin [Crenothrix polyspora]SJM93592.1 Antitoxin of toxin-antitoxin system StbD [Crenothrix polyspora]